MPAAKTLHVSSGSFEDAVTTFARDQLAALECADDGGARVRVWRRREAGLALGRFHRTNPDAPSAEARSVSRRLTGGRVVPVGPSVVCITLVAPTVDWLDPAGATLRPEQVLNRAVRPLLATLRGDGVDAFYGGRDLVTVRGRIVAHASFTVMKDGVAVVEMHVAERPAFPALSSLLDRFDPSGVAAVDRRAFDGATSLEEALGGASGRSDVEWAARFGDAAAGAFACSVTPAVEDRREVTLADAAAERSFFADPGPLEEGDATAATVAMLGIVECSGRLRGDRLTRLRVTGDLIAPFHALDDIAGECEGEPMRPDRIRKALARAMARPRSFVLGLRDLDQLIARLGET